MRLCDDDAGLPAHERDLERGARAVVSADGAAADRRGAAGDRGRQADGGLRGGVEADRGGAGAGEVSRRAAHLLLELRLGARAVVLAGAVARRCSQAAPTLAQALASVVGEERAQALLAAWRACVLSSQTFHVEPKPEMTSDSSARRYLCRGGSGCGSGLRGSISGAIRGVVDERRDDRRRLHQVRRVARDRRRRARVVRARRRSRAGPG